MSSTTPEKFILSWVAQMNYPVVEVQLIRQGSDTIFNFEQDRFLWSIYDEEMNPIYTSPYGYQFIPFYLSINNNSTQCIFKSYTWQIYVKCKAGGIYNSTGDVNQHIQGSIDDVNLFLATTRGKYILMQSNNRIYL